MKTLRRLYISTQPFSEVMKAERERASRVLEIPGVLRIINDYRQLPNILENLELESDDDIAEWSLKKYVSEPGYHNIYLVMNEDEWYELGLRTTLYGQSRTVDGQIISYGRPGTINYAVLHKHSDLIQDNFTESTLREWHELTHGLDEVLGLPHDNTHYHFYGFATKYKNVPGKHRRYVRKPDPLEAWRAMPWERLEDLEEVYKKDLIVELLQKVVALYKQMLAPVPKLVKPLREWDTARISQKYGNYNPAVYKLTGHHIGVDFAVGEYTPIYAPADGEIVAAGGNNTLGNYFIYKYAKNRWLVALHLAYEPELGKYEAGAELGEVGDTGFITGIHAHLEVWTIEPDREKVSRVINKDNWDKVTLDPLKAF